MPADRPFALVASGVHGLVISAVNAVAAAEGVTAGTALADARAALPTLLSRPADAEADRRGLLKLGRWIGRYGPNRHVDGGDGLWVDITGVAHLFGGEEALLDDVTRRLSCFGVRAFLGLADTFGAAHALARFGCPPGSTWALALPGATEDALAPLPVDALRLDGASVLLLKRLGLRRIGQLLDIPRDSLARRFRAGDGSRKNARIQTRVQAQDLAQDLAAAVVLRLDQALGARKEPLRAMRALPVLSVMRSFAEPLISSGPIEATAAVLADELAALLAEKDLGALAVRLTLYRADGTSAGVVARLSAPSRDGRHFMMLLQEKLAAIDAGFGIDALRLDAERVDRKGGRQEAFAEPSTGASGRSGVDGLIDRLSNRFGAQAVLRLEARESHIPERAEARMPANAPQQYAFKYEPPWPYGRGAYGGGDGVAASASRPPFLLPRPEPIEVLAEVPDGPPARFTWRRVERRIVRSTGPERIAPEWWRQIGVATAGKRARPRDYYRVEDQEGTAYWVFRHGLFGGEGETEADADMGAPRWYLHGMF